MVAGNAGYHAADFAACHALGLAHRLSDGLCGRIDIGNHAGFEAARFGQPHTDYVDFVIYYFSNQGDDFGRADIQRADILLFFNHMRCSKN